MQVGKNSLIGFSLFAVNEIFMSYLNSFIYSQKVANFVFKLAWNKLYNNLEKNSDQKECHYLYYFSQCRPNSELAFHLKLLCQLKRSKSASNLQSESTRKRSINYCEKQMENKREKRGEREDNVKRQLINALIKVSSRSKMTLNING